MTDETPKRRKRQKKGDPHYVCNTTFTKALDDYSRACRAAEADEKPHPQMSNYLGSCIIKMAERLSMSPGFRGYSYRDEMIQNAILAAVKYANKFNGDKFNNGFAYVTQILFSHMVITIKAEKKKYETNLKLIQQAQIDIFGNDEFSEEADSHARSIADQKLADIEDSKKEDTGTKRSKGFQLRSGYTKESRENYSGTPLNRDKDD